MSHDGVLIIKFKITILQWNGGIIIKKRVQRIINKYSSKEEATNILNSCKY